MNRVVIGAPFGNYLNFEDTTPTIGTFTLHHRAGPLKRLWRVLSTVRYNHQNRIWTNKLGLPNPGITSVRTAKDCILSIHGFNAHEWFELAVAGNMLEPLAIEFNFGCPNVTRHGPYDPEKAIKYLYHYEHIEIIAKLPPIRWMDHVVRLYDLGCSSFHCCNTIPSPGGGMSGKPLKQYSLWATEQIRQRYGRAVTIIGGGGIDCVQDVKDYISAGADRVAIASMLFNPLNWKCVPELVRTINEHFK